MSKRPMLNQIRLSEIDLQKPSVVVTMSEGQWDELLESAYDHGFILLELDVDEMPVKAYWKGHENDETN